MSSRALFDGSDESRDPARESSAGARVNTPDALTVSELVVRLKGAVEPPFRSVWVAGEISEFRQVASSGHAYFALKDGGAKINAKMWRTTLSRLRYVPENGAAVIAHGAIDLYAPTGGLSLTIDKIVPQGIGELAAAFEQLRKKLAAEGLFAEERKRPLPAFPRAIGLVTSREGAAIRDFLRHLTERFPTPVVLASSAVQGAAAPESLASAIFELSDHAEAWGLDVIVVVRGGGSLEDLAAFNAEVVARAIAASSVPILTGIGHEIDTTIADLVADRRAKTPTDAANCVVPDRDALIKGLTEVCKRMSLLADSRIGNIESELDMLEARIAASGPSAALDAIESSLGAFALRIRAASASRLDKSSREVERLRGRLRTSSPSAVVADWRRQFETAAAALRTSFESRWALRQEQLSISAARLHGVSPVAVLGRGYSLTRREGEAHLLRDAATLSVGDTVETRLARGSFRSRVERVDTKANES